MPEGHVRSPVKWLNIWIIYILKYFIVFFANYDFIFMCGKGVFSPPLNLIIQGMDIFVGFVLNSLDFLRVRRPKKYIHNSTGHA